jgi:hypothetical protein
MGLMDRMKEQAGQALTKAQQGVTQGKAKLGEAQAKHQWDALLRNLGAAVWAEKREGGPADAVTAALAALDTHLAAHAHDAGGETTDDDGATSGDGATDEVGTEGEDAAAGDSGTGED